MHAHFEIYLIPFYVTKKRGSFYGDKSEFNSLLAAKSTEISGFVKTVAVTPSPFLDF